MRENVTHVEDSFPGNNRKSAMQLRGVAKINTNRFSVLPDSDNIPRTDCTAETITCQGEDVGSSDASITTGKYTNRKPRKNFRKRFLFMQ